MGQTPPDTGGDDNDGGGNNGGGNTGGGGSGSSAPRTPEVRPEVASLSLASDPGPDFRYEAGDEIIVEATFSEPVRAMNEHLELGLSIGGEARTAGYAGGSGTESLRFSYVVGPEDRDLDGIGFPADALKDNFGRIHSLGGWRRPWTSARTHCPSPPATGSARRRRCRCCPPPTTRRDGRASCG